ncbi:hypothetical protein Barb6_00275 [Bacteroidales bacterium Barb6]|nr:hypothetical protein Barb6_00275 [Bacteroidales bacterium Barb6]
MEKEFRNYVSSLAADNTYVVSENCSISTKVNIPANVTLIFKGGIISRTGTLSGNNTNIIASITKIIETNIAGTWNVDRAYPQWFGAKINDANFDSTPAINKAIQFKNQVRYF